MLVFWDLLWTVDLLQKKRDALKHPFSVIKNLYHPENAIPFPGINPQNTGASWDEMIRQLHPEKDVPIPGDKSG